VGSIHPFFAQLAKSTVAIKSIEILLINVITKF